MKLGATYSAAAAAPATAPFATTSRREVNDCTVVLEVWGDFVVFFIVHNSPHNLDGRIILSMTNGNEQSVNSGVTAPGPSPSRDYPDPTHHSAHPPSTERAQAASGYLVAVVELE